MQEELGESFQEYQAALEKPCFRGLRVNPLKCSDEKVLSALPFPLQKTPFAEHSFYLPKEVPKLGSHPYHHAGAFYLQEPSACCAVSALSPQKGDKVLDLCAAPGAGKSTQIASMLGGEGLLWSNELVRNRALVLLSNIERMGIRNAVVSSCRPDVLCEGLAGFFDKVLVDAPCSGEGMFRKEEQARADWSLEHIAACAQRQLAILASAAEAVREGGILAYSTCTFSREENEEVVAAFLKNHPFVLEPIPDSFGRPAFGMPEARRVFPMDGGEGHFVARLRRTGPNERGPAPYRPAPEPMRGLGIDLLKELCGRLPLEDPGYSIIRAGGQLLLLPPDLPDLRRLGVIRAGVPLADIKKGRVEPAHGFFMAAQPQEIVRMLDFPRDSREISAFLRGEELDVPEGWKGYAGVAVDGILTGFGKCSGGRLKNKYPKGLRNHF